MEQEIQKLQQTVNNLVQEQFSFQTRTLNELNGLNEVRKNLVAAIDKVEEKLSMIEKRVKQLEDKALVPKDEKEVESFLKSLSEWKFWK